MVTRCLAGGGSAGGARKAHAITDRSTYVFPEDGPGCRAMVPYTPNGHMPRKPSPRCFVRRNLAPMLALPAPVEDAVADIPVEVFPLVFQYMDASTLCSVSSVSRQWRKQGNDDRYWRRLCHARFNVTPDAFAPPPDPIKRLYQLQHGSLRAMCQGCRPRYRSMPPTVSASTSAQLLMGLMASNAM